jgi:hypothetical protein
MVMGAIQDQDQEMLKISKVVKVGRDVEIKGG